MIKLKHLLTERLNWVSKKRARAELRQKISGQRNDGMGAYTGKIFGIGYKPKNNQDYSGPRAEITSMEELESGKYMIFALGDADMPDIGDDRSTINPGDALVFKMPRKRLGLFAAPANREYIEYDIEYKDDKQDDEGKPETCYVTVDAEYAQAAKKILDYMVLGDYELLSGDDTDVGEPGADTLKPDDLFLQASNILKSYSGNVNGIGTYIEYLSGFNNKGEEYLQDAIREVIKKIGQMSFGEFGPNQTEEKLLIALEKLVPQFDKQGKYLGKRY